MNLGQSVRASMVEAGVSTAIGLVLQMGGQHALFVLFHTNITPAQFFGFTGAMTVLSVVRQFGVRRLFNSEVWKRWKRTRTVSAT